MNGLHMGIPELLHSMLSSDLFFIYDPDLVPCSQYILCTLLSIQRLKHSIHPRSWYVMDSADPACAGVPALCQPKARETLPFIPASVATAPMDLLGYVSPKSVVQTKQTGTDLGLLGKGLELAQVLGPHPDSCSLPAQCPIHLLPSP